MFSILILEDDSTTADMLKRIITEINEEINIVHFSNEGKAYEYAVKNTVNLFILDVNLDDGGSGYNFAERIRKLNQYEMTFIIFVTAVAGKKYLALEHLHCYEYMVKPINEEKLKNSLEKVMKYKIVNHNASIALHKGRRSYIIKLIDIAWVEVNFRAVTIHRPDNKTYSFPSYKYTLERFQEMPNNNFVRIQKSMLVNKDYIESVDYAKELVFLSTTEAPLRLGKRYIDRIREVFG